MKQFDISPEGWIREFLRRDAEGFAGKLDILCAEASSDIFATGRVGLEHKGWWGTWWNGETEGNWIDGFTRLAYALNHPEYREKAARHLEHILKYQDADGYIGIYKAESRFGNGSRNGELWCQSRIMLALLAYYDAERKEHVLNALKKMADLTIRHYGPLAQNRSYFDEPDEDGGKTHGIMIIEPLLMLYDITGDERIVEFCRFLYDDFSKTPTVFPGDDGRLPSLLDPESKFVGHGPHICEQLRIPLLIYCYTGIEIYKKAFLMAFEKLKNHIVISGACKSDEMIGSCPPGGEMGFDMTEGVPLPTVGYEYCAVTELLLSFHAAFAITGDREWADMAEWLMFNAGMAGRLPDGKGIQYLSADNLYEASSRKGTRWDYSPVHADAAVCCVPNAARIMPYHLSRMWMHKGGDCIVAAFYGPCTLNCSVNGVKVRIREITEFPFEDVVRMEIRCEKAVEFKLLLRIPGWSNGYTLEINGEKYYGYEEEQGLLGIKRLWKDGDRAAISFKRGICIKKSVDNSAAVSCGPLLYSLDIPVTKKNTYEYPIAGFFDMDFLPDEKSEWHYTLILDAKGENHKYFRIVENKAEREGYPWEKPPVRIDALVLNEASQQMKIPLVPIGCTTLRRTCFPYVSL